MKIAVISHTHHPIRQPFTGGLEAHTYQLVAKLTKLGHEVTLFCKAGSKTSAHRQRIIFKGDALAGGNRLLQAGYHNAMDYIAIADFDFIINNSLNSIPLLRHTDTMPPMLTVFHTPPFEELIQTLRSQLDSANRTYVAVSKFTAQQWQSHCPSRIHVVSNGINLADWQESIQLPAAIKAAWVGRITPEKGTHIAIQACLAAGIPLKLAGPIYDKQYFNTMIKPLLRNPTIQYVNHLDHTGVNKLFRTSSVALVTPLWDEPFGLVAAEAWASGTPVAALPSGALPTLVKKDIGSLAANNTPEALTDAITSALKINRSACRLYAENNFSVLAMVNNYLQFAPTVIDQDNPDLVWQLA